MTVGQLKLLLKNVPDDTVILVPSFDHSYREVTPRLIEAAEPDEEALVKELGALKAARKRPGWGDPTHYEWYGDKRHFDEPVRVVKALLVS